MEPTALRTRLQMFLFVEVTPREVHCLFKKFDPNNIGSVNMGKKNEIYDSVTPTL